MQSFNQNKNSLDQLYQIVQTNTNNCADIITQLVNKMVTIVLSGSQLIYPAKIRLFRSILLLKMVII